MKLQSPQLAEMIPSWQSPLSWHAKAQSQIGTPTFNPSQFKVGCSSRKNSSKTFKSSKNYPSTPYNNSAAYRWTESHYPSTFGDLCRKKRKLQTSLRKTQ